MAAVIDLQVKKRRVNEKDWKQVEEYVKKELSRRETDSFRKLHELIWKEVDRQVYMKAPEVRNRDKNDWHSAVELGELAKASETITADVMRLLFPNSRAWFESHVEIPSQLDPNTGKNTTDQKAQFFIDGVIRALMAQQHLDFGLKSRIALSVKEALHHGSFVAEARDESAMLVYGGSGIQSVKAPVWVPHSMWNCYPDPNPSVIGSNMFYTGSMIIKEYMPRYKLKDAARIEFGWMPSQISKIPKRKNQNKDVETDDLELVKYFGDCVIERNDGDIFLPNSKVILANGVIVFYAPNKLPFPNILYNGYEKLDVRDPYFTSPLIKLSPMHKLATTIANKYVDCIALNVEPPGAYDANDPQMVADGGPKLVPSAMTGTKYLGKGVQFFPVGDPNAALAGLQLTLDQIKKGHGSDAAPVFNSPGDKTATEARIENQRGEVRVVDFVDKLEFSLKSFLYMQHEINKQELETYSFYNPEMDAPDFMRMTREELPQSVHFDVVGSRGILGEEERSQKTSVVTAFASGNPLFAPLLKPIDILKEMYQDAGVKNPERFLNVPNDEMQAVIDRVKQEAQQVIDELQQKNFELEKNLAISKAVNGARIAEAQTHANVKADLATFEANITAQLESIKTGLKIAETQAKQEEATE